MHFEQQTMIKIHTSVFASIKLELQYKLDEQLELIYHGSDL